MSALDHAQQPVVSVVMPTCNRLDILPEVLSALAVQQGAPPFELIVIDDGSTDGTAAWLAGWSARGARAVRVVGQSNQGPAAARNRGVALARGRWVAFLGDDTVPDPGWLRAVTEALAGSEHGERAAVIGRTEWHQRMRRNAFLCDLNENGLQFGFGLIGDPDNVPWNFFYTSNLGASRSLLQAEPFDTAFPYPAWEDIELGYRLWMRHGLRLCYRPRARVYHHHPTSLRRFCRRQWQAGYSAVVFARRHPELADWLGVGRGGVPPLGRRPHLRAALAHALQFLPALPARRTPRAVTGLWEGVLRWHYAAGLHAALSAGPARSR